MRLIATILIIAGALGLLWLLFRPDEKPQEPKPELDEELVTRVGIELHGIRRKLDVAWTRTQLRRDAAAMRRELTEDLNAADSNAEERW